MNYNFLTNLTLVDTGRLRTPKSTNPSGLTIRIMSNGDVYPSQELVNLFDLEYKSAASEDQGYGFDVVDSHKWAPTMQFPRMIIFAVTPKTEAKVDLFASCKYYEDGTPKASVMTQGSLNQELLDLVKEMGYLTEEQKYCDLEFVISHPINVQDNIAYLPKTIAKGLRKGEPTYERREKVRMYVVNTVENLKEQQTVTANSGTTTVVEPVETEAQTSN